MPERTVANRRPFDGVLHPEEAFARLVDAFVSKLPAELVVAKENKLLIQKINRVTFTSKVWEIHNFLVALLVFAENFNLSSGRENECHCRSTHIGVGSLGQAKTKGKNDWTTVAHNDADISSSALQVGLFNRVLYLKKSGNQRFWVG